MAIELDKDQATMVADFLEELAAEYSHLGAERGAETIRNLRSEIIDMLGDDIVVTDDERSNGPTN